MLPNQIPAAAPEIAAFGSALADLISDIKAGKTALQDIEDAVTDLVGAVSGIQNVGLDIKKASNQAFLLWAIGQAFEPA